jgi:4-oxalocrotonate tautomerase
MPIVRIEMLPGRSQAAKERVAESITKLLVREFSTAEEHVYVMFAEVDRADWAVGGQFFDENHVPIKKGDQE